MKGDAFPRLRGRVAIVTGAGHGMGRVLAGRLAREAAHVVIAERDGAAGEAAAAELRDEGRSCVAVRTDVTSAASLASLVEKALTITGRIDILVNNAAMFATVPMSRTPFDAISDEEWDRMMEVNLKGVWLGCRAVVPTMRETGYGKIVNVSSTTALVGSPTRIHYVTSKAGLLGFTRSLARELGTAGIRVNCIAPGSTRTTSTRDEDLASRSSSAGGDRALDGTQTADDVAGAVAFFASADSDFITGQTLVVDGGAHMH